MNIRLDGPTIALFKSFLMEPEKYGCNYKPMRECFVEADEYTPQHILFQQYVDYLQKPLPKVIFYIIMREVYPEYFGKQNDKGDLGYKLKLIVTESK